MIMHAIDNIKLNNKIKVIIPLMFLLKLSKAIPYPLIEFSVGYSKNELIFNKIFWLSVIELVVSVCIVEQIEPVVVSG